MLVEQLQKEWRARAGFVAPTPRFDTDELVLGAGTVLAKRSPGTFNEERLKALLAVAYGEAGACKALGHVRLAAARWCEGDQGRAELHLELSGLRHLALADEAVHRLFLADGLLKRGVAPEAILHALNPEKSAARDLLKYSPDQPRVPAGNGRPSGRWTAGGANTVASTPQPPTPSAKTPEVQSQPNKPQAVRPAAARPSRTGSGVAPKAPRDPRPPLAPPRLDLAPVPVRPHASRGQASSRARFEVATALAAAGVGPLAPELDIGAWSGAATRTAVQFLARIGAVVLDGAAAVAAPAVLGFGLALIPNPVPAPRWMKIGGPGNVSYFLRPEETAIQFRYTARNGTLHTIRASLSPNGNYQDPNGRTVARWVKIGAKVALLVSVATLLAQDTGNQPNLCPEPKPDRKGARAKNQDYEDYIKSIVNPNKPTPRGMAYWFVNPQTGRSVVIDDCQRQTGYVFEIKGSQFARRFKTRNKTGKGMLKKIINQARRQLMAAQGREVWWVFEEEYAADYVLKRFQRIDKGLEKIKIWYQPAPWMKKCATTATLSDRIGGVMRRGPLRSAPNFWRRSIGLVPSTQR